MVPIITRWYQSWIVNPRNVKHLIGVPFHSLNQRPSVADAEHCECNGSKTKLQLGSHLLHFQSAQRLKLYHRGKTPVSWPVNASDCRPQSICERILCAWPKTCPNCWHWIWYSSLPDAAWSKEIASSSLADTQISPLGLQQTLFYAMQPTFQET